jgi:hypothetical protein
MPSDRMTLSSRYWHCRMMPAEMGERLAAGRPQSGGDGVSPFLVEIGEPAAGHGIERFQHGDHMCRIAPEALENIAKDRIVAGTRHAIRGARGNRDPGEAPQGAAPIR